MTERRKCRRFPIECPASFRILNGVEASQRGQGSTVNISSRGVLLAVDRPVAKGALLEVSVEWPAKLDNRSGLKLILRGSVIRSEKNRIAVTIQKHEFRTAGRGGLFLVERCPGAAKMAASEVARLQPDAACGLA
jgi:hypothetical protein